MKRTISILTIIFILFFSASAYAKAESDTLRQGDIGVNFLIGGLVLGEGFFPGNSATISRFYGIGLIAHITNSLAVEPGLFFMRDEDEEHDEVSGSDGYDKDLYLGTSIGLFYYANIKGGMYLYTGPRFEYSFHKSEEKSSGGYKYETTYHDLGLSAVFGLKYMFGSRFGIFGDIALGFSYSKSKYKAWDSSGTLTDDEERKNNRIHLTRALLGAVFYF